MAAAEESPALAALVANHRRFLEFVERRVGDRATAEDILQEAFARGLDKLGALANDESAVAWFYRSLRNALVDHHRRRGAAGRALASFAAELDRDRPSGELHEEACRCVIALAATLEPEYASALGRIDVEGASVKDYAHEAGVTPGNAAVRVFRARAALRRQLARACGTCADHGCFDCTCRPPATARSTGA